MMFAVTFHCPRGFGMRQDGVGLIHTKVIEAGSYQEALGKSLVGIIDVDKVEITKASITEE